MGIRIPPYIGWPLLAAFAYAILYIFAQRVLFQPMKFPRGWWEVQEQIGAEDVWLTTSDGVKLHGWWQEAPDSDIVTLYLHGNAGNVTHRGSHGQQIVAAGSSVLVIDYRGYGKSEGRPTESGLYEDAETAYRYLIEKGYRPERVVLHGESLGSAVAVELATRHPVGGVVLEAPFTSAGDVAGRLVPLLGPLVVRSFRSKDKINSIGAPLLVIHGEADRVIAFDFGKALFEAAPEPKEFWALPGADHNNIVESAGSQYRKRLSGFYDTLGSS